MSALPCRIVHHLLSDGSSHLDLFVSDPELETLPTYGVEGEGMERFFLELKKERGVRFHLRAASGESEDERAEGAILLSRKKNHRRIYWGFSGEISEGRGKIREICRGILDIRGNLAYFVPD